MDDAGPTSAKPLYANFLEKKSTYNLTRHFWKEQFEAVFAVFEHPYQAYHEEQNYNGDPIFTAYFPSMGRSVRIKQRAPEREQLKIDAQLGQVSPDLLDQPVTELQIDLVLSKQSANLTRQLLRQWIIAFLPAEKMEKEIRRRLKN